MQNAATTLRSLAASCGDLPANRSSLMLSNDQDAITEGALRYIEGSAPVRHGSRRREPASFVTAKIEFYLICARLTVTPIKVQRVLWRGLQCGSSWLFLRHC